MQRLRHQLREYFPAALEAFGDLDAPDVLELLGNAPDPARAARLARAQVSAALPSPTPAWPTRPMRKSSPASDGKAGCPWP